MRLALLPRVWGGQRKDGVMVSRDMWITKLELLPQIPRESRPHEAEKRNVKRRKKIKREHAIYEHMWRNGGEEKRPRYCSGGSFVDSTCVSKTGDAGRKTSQSLYDIHAPVRQCARRTRDNNATARSQRATPQRCRPKSRDTTKDGKNEWHSYGDP